MTECYNIDLFGTGLFPLAMKPPPCQKAGGMTHTQTHLSIKVTQIGCRSQAPIKSTHTQEVRSALVKINS